MTKAEQTAMRSYLRNVLKVNVEQIEPIMAYLSPLSNEDAAHAVQVELEKLRPKA